MININSVIPNLQVPECKHPDHFNVKLNMIYIDHYLLNGKWSKWISYPNRSTIYEIKIKSSSSSRFNSIICKLKLNTN